MSVTALKFDTNGAIICEHSTADRCYGCGHPAEDVYSLLEWLCRKCAQELFDL